MKYLWSHVFAAVGEYLDPGVDLRLALEPDLRDKVSSTILASELVQEEKSIKSGGSHVYRMYFKSKLIASLPCFINNQYLTGNQGMLYDGWMLDTQKNQTKKLTIKAFKGNTIEKWANSI